MSASEALIQCNSVDSFYKFVQSLDPKIGTWGGRRFYNKTNAGDSVCINDVAVRLKTLYPTFPKTDEGQKIAEKIISEIQSKNTQAASLLVHSSLLMRILTAIKSWISSFRINRDQILIELSLAISKAKQESQKNYSTFLSLSSSDQVKNFKNLSWDYQFLFAKDHPACLLVLTDQTPGQTLQKIDLLKAYVESFFNRRDLRGLARALTEMQQKWKATPKEIDLLYSEDFIPMMHCMLSSEYWNQIPLYKPSDPKALNLFKLFCPGRVWFDLFFHAGFKAEMNWDEFNKGLNVFIHTIICLCKNAYNPLIIKNKLNIAIPLIRGFCSILLRQNGEEQANKIKSVISLLATLTSDLDDTYAKNGVKGDFSLCLLKYFERENENNYRYILSILANGPLEGRNEETIRQNKPYMFMLSCIFFASPSAFQRLHKILSKDLPQNYLDVFKERCWYYTDPSHRQFIHRMNACIESIHAGGVPTLKNYCLQALKRIPGTTFNLPVELKELLDIYIKNNQTNVA